MNFHNFNRRDLQAMSKINNIPANLTNAAMANALQSLESIEWVEEIKQNLMDGTRTTKGKKEEVPAEAVDTVVVDTPAPQRGRRKAVETPAQGVVPRSSARLTRQSARRLAESTEGTRVRTLTKMVLDPADDKEAETDVIELGRATEPKPADKLEVEEVADQNQDVDLVKEDELVSDEKLNLVEHHAEQIVKPPRLSGEKTDTQWRKFKEQWDQLQREVKIMEEKQAQVSVDSIFETESVQALVAQVEVLKSKYCEEMARSRRLFNELQESKGNIRVFCRCRPLNKDEIIYGYKAIVDFDTARDGEIGILTDGATKKTFKFDRIFTPKDDQADVYADASPLVTSVLDGYNVCIFAYGQTGTGKTFTMEGTERKRGVNYLTLEELFQIAEERKETVSYGISVSVLEVYNEQIRDLLNPNPSSKKLELRAEGDGLHHIPGLVETEVESTEEVWNVLQAGINARAIGSNNVNKHSSRSHCMLCVTVKANNLVNGECSKSKLWLVDLAGSERLAKTDVQGERLKEAQNINRSLSALGDVISALANKSNHIPYRNSKLTHLLQDSLAGGSKALMFVQISPSDNDLGETLGSLNFASRVRGIEMGPAKKQADTSEVQKMKQIIEKLKQEARLKDENIHSLENKLKGSNKSLQEKMEIQKAEYEATLQKQNRQLSEKLKEKDEICSTLRQKVRSLEGIIKELRDKPTQMNYLVTPKANEMSKILANSNCKKPPVAATVSMKDSVLLSGVESLHETKRKRTSDSVPGDNENSVPVVELKKKSVLSELGNSSKTRRIDPTRGLARLTRSTSGASSTHNALPNGRAAGKEQPTGSKMRGWVR